MQEVNLTPLVKAIYQVWDQIGPDALEFVEDNEEAIEMCLDANRLEYYSNNQEAIRLYNFLTSNYGYDKTLSMLSKKVYLM